MNLQESILSELKKQPLTPFELSLILNKSTSSITSRISELKKKGYKIELKPEKTNRYHFMSDPPTTADKIILWIDSHRAFKKNIKYSFIAKQLNLPESEIKKGYEKLFKTHHIIQTSNSSAKIL